MENICQNTFYVLHLVNSSCKPCNDKHDILIILGKPFTIKGRTQTKCTVKKAGDGHRSVALRGNAMRFDEVHALYMYYIIHVWLVYIKKMSIPVNYRPYKMMI